MVDKKFDIKSTDPIVGITRQTKTGVANRETKSRAKIGIALHGPKLASQTQTKTVVALHGPKTGVTNPDQNRDRTAQAKTGCTARARGQYKSPPPGIACG